MPAQRSTRGVALPADAGIVGRQPLAHAPPPTAPARQFGTADFSRWAITTTTKGRRSLLPPQQPRNRVSLLVQYHLHTQLSEIHFHARSQGVVLRSDTPIGVSRTSYDAWIHRGFRDSQAGTARRLFRIEPGRSFPTYDWSTWRRTAMRGGRPAWQARIFRRFRIDHILGFFRIWEIPVHAIHDCWSYSIPPCPTPPTNCAAWASIRLRDASPFRARRPDARRTVHDAGRRSAHDRHEGGPAAYPPMRRNTRSPSAPGDDPRRSRLRRADGAARRRAVHRGPAPQGFPSRIAAKSTYVPHPRPAAARDTRPARRPFTAATTGSGRSRPCANSPCSSRRRGCWPAARTSA